MSIKDFTKELDGGLPRPVYFIHSDETFLLREAVDGVKALVPDEEKDFSLNLYDFESDEAVSVPEVTDTLKTVSFFGGRRVVVLENIQKAKVAELKDIAAYVKAPGEGSLLVITSAGKLKKTVKDAVAGAKDIALSMREREYPFWITQRAKSKGLDISGDAVEFLLGTVGPDLGLLASEIEKYALMGRREVGVDDVRALSAGGGDYNVFDLADAIKAKDAEKALFIYRKISGNTESYSMLGALNWKLASHPNVPDEVFALLNEADVKIKTSGGFHPLEDLILRLARV